MLYLPSSQRQSDASPKGKGETAAGTSRFWYFNYDIYPTKLSRVESVRLGAVCISKISQGDASTEGRFRAQMFVYSIVGSLIDVRRVVSEGIQSAHSRLVVYADFMIKGGKKHWYRYGRYNFQVDTMR